MLTFNASSLYKSNEYEEILQKKLLIKRRIEANKFIKQTVIIIKFISAIIIIVICIVLPDKIEIRGRKGFRQEDSLLSSSLIKIVL